MMILIVQMRKLNLWVLDICLSHAGNEGEVSPVLVPHFVFIANKFQVHTELWYKKKQKCLLLVAEQLFYSFIYLKWVIKLKTCLLKTKWVIKLKTCHCINALQEISTKKAAYLKFQKGEYLQFSKTIAFVSEGSKIIFIFKISTT